MRKTGNAVFVAMLATLMVGMTALGASAGPKGIGKVPAGVSSVAATIAIDAYDALALEPVESVFTDDVVTFTYGGDGVTYAAMIVNATFPAGITLTDATVTGGTCDISGPPTVTINGSAAAISGVLCDATETIELTVDGTSTLAEGTYPISAEYKVYSAKRQKTLVMTNMWQVFDLDAIQVTIPAPEI